MLLNNRESGALGAPLVVLDIAQADHLEALAAGAMRRAPGLADRLLTEIARAVIVPNGDLPPDVVAIGREVSYRDETTGREQTVILVLPQDADIARNRASVLTPIGVALIGLREGASFSWETRSGEPRRLTVTRVASPPRPYFEPGMFLASGQAPQQVRKTRTA
jgi:regulator of nucleoside diphosphate kinase